MSYMMEREQRALEDWYERTREAMRLEYEWKLMVVEDEYADKQAAINDLPG